MDFRRLELSDEDARFRAEVRELIATHLTPELRERVRRSGSSHDPGFVRALGERGWILPERAPEQGGAGLGRLRCELLELELERADAPLMAVGTTKLTVPAIEAFADPDLAAEVLSGIARGEVFVSLGYTEPDGGSDIAAAKTRAVRDGEGWTINGSKMFTTEAHNCQYSFLLTRTDPDLPKHRGLTMFLVPLESEGVEIGPIHTVGGERTNVVYYSDVRVADRFRLGEVGDGWRVLMGPLAAEHGAGRESEIGPLSVMGQIPLQTLQGALDRALAWAGEGDGEGAAPLADPALRDRLARIATDLEAAGCLADPLGRIYASEACIRGCAELLDLVGPASLVERGEPGAVADGALEQAHRFAQGTAIYGGTVEIFKNMAAQHLLGLPRQLPPAQ